MSRPYKSGGRIPGGGVAAVIANDVDYNICHNLCHPDLLVLELPDLYIICAYLLPATSNWRTWSNTDPCTRLAEAIAVCSMNPTKPSLIMGDLNARTASTQSMHSLLDRSSPDTTCNTRGNWLLDICDAHDLHILNGSSREIGSTKGSWTSFQPLGTSVIDYVIASSALLLSLSKMEVTRRQPDDDHASIQITVMITERGPESGLSQTIPSRMMNMATLYDPAAPNSPLDILAQDLISQSSLSDEESLVKLYGPVYFSANPTLIWVAVVSRRDSVAVCCSWGLSNGCSIDFHLERSQLEAGLLAIIAILRRFSPHRPLLIYTSIKYLINTLAHWAGRMSRQGWPGSNADLIKVATTLIRLRSATVDFRTVNHSKLSPNSIWVDTLQKARRILEAKTPPFPLAVVDEIPDWNYPADTAPLVSVLKVKTDVLAPTTQSSRPPTHDHLDHLPLESPADVDHTSQSHRGRARVRQQMWNNLCQLLRSREGGSYWALLRKWSDAKPKPMVVAVDALRSAFEMRMNPPKELPPSFDAGLFAMHQLHANAIPQSTVDISPNLDFSRPFTVEEIDEAKCHIRSRSLDTAKGIDGVGYADLINLESDNLAELFNMCVNRRDAPNVWLTTLLVGILKRGCAAEVPDNYRLIALECCLLKMMTLLIDRRLRAWMTGQNILPNSQNGFRAGYRTNNCPFIIRCAIDRCRADGDTLYIAFMDLTNAFPSTNLPTLWLKLYENGAKGPVIDWLRMIYSRMQYVVGSGANAKECSERFRALWGILAGDTASPGLFNFFMSDFRPPSQSTDIVLNGIRVANVEMADDVALFSKSRPQTLQVKIDYMYNTWCRENFLVINGPKSEAMVFGLLPPSLPTFMVGQTTLKIVDSFKYVGVTFQSTHRHIFASHYYQKASMARSIMNSTLAMESFIGAFPVREAIRIYMARIDPHLISGCEVSVDVDPLLLEQLEDVQVSFLRRILGLNDRSIRAVLFTETGVMPIKYRRLIITLRYVIYLLSLPVDHYARAAFDDSISLWTNGEPSWMGDIQFALLQLPIPVPFLPTHTLDASHILALISDVEGSAVKSLQADIANSVRTHLLWTPRGQIAADNLCMSKYMQTVFVDAHRKSLTRLLCSAHCLAVETLRHRPRSHTIPREHRLCRFCRENIEDEAHAVFLCTAEHPDVVAAREDFFENLGMSAPEWKERYTELDASEFIREIIRDKKAVIPFAKLAHKCLKAYEEFDIYVPSQYIIDTT